MKKIVLFISLCLGFYSGYAQLTEVIGKVATQEKGIVLPLAGVYLQQIPDGKWRQVSSNDKGEFVFKGVSAGTYRIKASYIGYRDQWKEIKVEGQTLEVLLWLEQVMVINEELLVQSTRINKKTAGAYTLIDSKEIQKQNFGQDLPFLLNLTPSSVVNSDAGAGVGYTGVRFRGSDPTRTNVTINGIPLNDPESHGVFWVNLPDLSSSAQSVQVQLGAGTSTNGAAAFGASINIQTRQVSEKPYAQVDITGGSFHTQKYTVLAGTGLMENNWSFDIRGSQIRSDGFIDRASSSLQSAFISATKSGKKSLLKMNAFTGKEVTYQAWNGIPEARYKGDVQAMEKLRDNLYMGTEEYEQMIHSNNRTYNSFTYKNQTDNYQQDHYQLFYTYSFNNRLKANAGLHYTYGRGYYEEYRSQEKFSKYKLNVVVIGNDTLTQGNFIRRRWLDNDFYGAVASLIYDRDKVQFILGGGLNQYDGRHFGELIWSEFASNGNINDHFYDGKSSKNEWNAYAKANVNLSSSLHAFVDVQARGIQYKLKGEDLNGSVYIPYDFNLKYFFFNPKAGLNYKWKKAQEFYVYVGVANREPVRSDIIQASKTSIPKPERMFDHELGYRWTGKKAALGVNVFYMYYLNQLVNTGQINDVGAYNRVNVGKSHRRGIELTLGYQLLQDLKWQATLAISQNRIAQFDEYLDNWDTYTQEVIAHKNSQIAFSPSVICGSQLSWKALPNTELTLLSKYVSRQYLDNTENSNRALPAFFVNDIRIRQNLNFKNNLKSLSAGLLLNNILDVSYVPNGYTFSGIISGQRTDFNYYFPQAGRNFLLQLSFLF